MSLFFQDPLFEDFATSFGLGLGSHGGSEPGEIQATCSLIKGGDEASWYEAWRATADRLAAAGEVSEKAGHAVSAREAYLRASLYYSLAYHPLFGAPVDPRLLEAFGRQRSAFDRAAQLFDRPGQAFDIDFDGARLPAYLFLAPHAPRPGPLLIATNGYDATIYEMFLAQALPALRRGYHCLIFDGPGQGAVLYEQGVPIRPDWETVVGAAVDAVIGRPEVDQQRIALTGWSLGGHLSLRAASGEHRLGACVADPALYAITSVMEARLRVGGVPASVIEQLRSGDLQGDEPMLSAIQQGIEANRSQRWAILQRGFWVHGVSSLADYFNSAAAFTLDGRAGNIRCPTLLATAEADPLSASAEQVYDALSCPKSLVQFKTAEGAGDHCEMLNRSLLDQRVFDWLDGILGTSRPGAAQSAVT
jgi:alpha-beta hydrolase superfamily lysophospholipase